MSGISERIKTAALKEKISRGDALGVSPAAPYLPNITVRQKDAGQKRETLKNSREALEKASENISGRFALNSGSGIVKNIRYFTQERELEQQISHAREMENTYSELHGSHKTTAQEKQAALEQKNRFAAEAREAEGKLESLRAQKPYSTFDPYKSISERADFKAYAAKGAAISNEYKTSEVEGAVTGWEFFSEEEKDIYNYILGKYGDEAAKRYWNYMQEPTRQRQGEIYKQRLDAIDSDIGRGTAKAAFGFLSGIENAMGGLVQAVTKEELPTSGVQYGSQMIRNELGGAGAVGYDLLYSTGNMLPSMFLSGALGAAGVPAAGAIGSGALGVSAGGNAYKQALSEGYGAQEAAAYGRIIGISESCMQYLLGGISKLGGTSAAIAKRVEGIEKGFIRGIAKTGGAVISEASEEALQSIVEPIFRHAIFGEDAEIDWAEVAYSALLGGLSGGMLEGPGIISSEMAAGRAKVGTAAPTGSGENESTIMTRGDAGTITQDNKKRLPGRRRRRARI